ncbi:thioredoxin domain-containing protein, partial [Myxococcota bacterium]|nr:thioredoxin domain-containing protein [Myxococcota bacterium]
FFFFLGSLLGGFFLPLGKKGKSTKCPDCKSGFASKGEGARGAVGAGPIKRVNLRIPADAPFVGPKNAPVSIVVFEDFKCPWCKRATDVVDNVLKAYPRDARFVLMNFPLARHKGAQEAAEAGIEAMAQGKFAALKKKMFDNSRQITPENIIKWAGEVGMDVNKLKAAFEKKTHEPKVKSQVLAGRFIGVRGTPTILVNGRKFNMTKDLKKTEEDLKAMIREELQIIAKQRIPRDKAYAMLTRNGERNLQALSGNPRGKKDPRGKNARPPRVRKVVDPNVVYNVTTDFSKLPVKGGKQPLVTIVEFSDFQCPYCGRGEKTMKEVLDKYKDDVRIVFLHNPLRFHKRAMPAANAAMEVLAQKGPSEAYWKYHNHLFDNRKDLTDENLVKWAKELAGADPVKVKAALDGKTHEAQVNEMMKFGAKFGVRGTPAFFINGYFVSGARPLPAFASIIDREIAKAKKAIEEKKATRADIYKFAVGSGLAQAKYIEQKMPDRKAQRRQRPRLDTTKVYKIDVKGLPFFGDPNDDVVMTIGFDVQCPYCGKIMDILEQVIEGDGKDFKGMKKGVKIALIHYPLPFHKDAQLAHEAIQEVFNQKGPEGLYAYLKLLKKDSRKLPREVLDAHAKTVGVNMAKFKEALDKNTHKAFVQATMKAGRQIGVMGTPAVYINGKSVNGRSLPLFRKLIDDAKAEAVKYMKANPGVTPAKYYEAIQKTATPNAVWIQPADAKGAPGMPGMPGGRMPNIRRLRPGQPGKPLMVPGGRGAAPRIKRIAPPKPAPMK